VVMLAMAVFYDRRVFLRRAVSMRSLNKSILIRSALKKYS
jgi:hypothetical protein